MDVLLVRKLKQDQISASMKNQDCSTACSASVALGSASYLAARLADAVD